MSFASPPESLGTMPDLQAVGAGPGTVRLMQAVGVSGKMLGWRRRALLGLSPYSHGEGAGPARRVKNRLRAAGCDEEGDRRTQGGGLLPSRRAAAP